MILGQVANATLKQPDDLSRVGSGSFSRRLRQAFSRRFSAARNRLLVGNKRESDFLFVFEAHFAERLKNSILVKRIESFCHGNSRSVEKKKPDKVYKGRESLSNSYFRFSINGEEHD